MLNTILLIYIHFGGTMLLSQRAGIIGVWFARRYSRTRGEFFLWVAATILFAIVCSLSWYMVWYSWLIG